MRIYCKIRWVFSKNIIHLLEFVKVINTYIHICFNHLEHVDLPVRLSHVLVAMRPYLCNENSFCPGPHSGVFFEQLQLVAEPCLRQERKNTRSTNYWSVSPSYHKPESTLSARAHLVRRWLRWTLSSARNCLRVSRVLSQHFSSCVFSAMSLIIF